MNKDLQEQTFVVESFPKGEGFVNSIRTALFDVTDLGIQSRKEMLKEATLIQLAARVGMAVTAILGASLLLAASPVLGILGALAMGFCFTVFRDVSVMAGNTKNLLNDNGSWSDLGQRVKAMTSENAMANSILSNTWLAEPLLKDILVTQLKKEF